MATDQGVAITAETWDFEVNLGYVEGEIDLLSLKLDNKTTVASRVPHIDFKTWQASKWKAI